MAFGARALIPPLGLVIAALATYHAASEIGLPQPELGIPVPASMGARALALSVDRGFRTEMSQNGPQDLAQLPPLSESLMAMAQTSYSVDPLEVATIRTLALGSVLHENKDHARRLMRLAAEISKRDVVLNMWLAQDYGRDGEAALMVAAFDHALRTSARARAFAMKPLVENLADPNSHRPIGELLRQQPEWERDFWNEFVGNPVALRNAAAFFAGSKLSYDVLPPYARVRLYANLKQAKLFDTLFRLAELDSNIGADLKRLAEGRLVDAGKGNPLGWTTHSRGTHASRIHGATGELQIDARAGSFGLVADRIVQVGETSAASLTMAEPVPEHVELELTVRCVEGSNRELGALTLRPGENAREVVLQTAGCRYASLAVSFVADTDHANDLIRVANVRLHSI